MEQESLRAIIVFMGLATIVFALYMVVSDPKIEKKGHK